MISPTSSWPVPDVHLVYLALLDEIITNVECFLQGLKNQTQVKLNIVSCPPVTTVLIKRPDLKYQLGFSVQNGIVSLFILSILGMKSGLGKQLFLNRRGQPNT